MTSDSHRDQDPGETWHERSPATGTGELPILSPRPDPQTHRGYAHGTDPRRWRILAVLLVAIFMSLVAVSIINVGLPSIQEGLGASESQLQWILSGYALTFGVVLVAGGRAGDVEPRLRRRPRPLRRHQQLRICRPRLDAAERPALRVVPPVVGGRRRLAARALALGVRRLIRPGASRPAPAGS